MIDQGSIHVWLSEEGGDVRLKQSLHSLCPSIPGHRAMSAGRVMIYLVCNDFDKEFQILHKTYYCQALSFYE